MTLPLTVDRVKYQAPGRDNVFDIIILPFKKWKKSVQLRALSVWRIQLERSKGFWYYATTPGTSCESSRYQGRGLKIGRQDRRSMTARNGHLTYVCRTKHPFASTSFPSQHFSFKKTDSLSLKTFLRNEEQATQTCHKTSKGTWKGDTFQ